MWICWTPYRVCQSRVDYGLGESLLLFVCSFLCLILSFFVFLLLLLLFFVCSLVVVVLACICCSLFDLVVRLLFFVCSCLCSLFVLAVLCLILLFFFFAQPQWSPFNACICKMTDTLNSPVSSHRQEKQTFVLHWIFLICQLSPERHDQVPHQADLFCSFL